MNALVEIGLLVQAIGNLPDRVENRKETALESALEHLFALFLKRITDCKLNFNEIILRRIKLKIL